MENGNNNNQTENSDMAGYLREIPFRIMARKRNIDEELFIKKVYEDSKYKDFFLSENTSTEFNKIGKILNRNYTKQVQKYMNKKFRSQSTDSHLKKKSDVQDDDDEEMTYSKILRLNATTKFTAKKEKQKPEITREYLENISPSAISEDFKEYSQIDFNANDVVIPSREFGNNYKTLVDLFLNQMKFDEEVISLMILYGLGLDDVDVQTLKRYNKDFDNESDDEYISFEENQFPKLPVRECKTI